MTLCGCCAIFFRKGNDNNKNSSNKEENNKHHSDSRKSVGSVSATSMSSSIKRKNSEKKKTGEQYKQTCFSIIQKTYKQFHLTHNFALQHMKRLLGLSCFHVYRLKWIHTYIFSFLSVYACTSITF